VTRSSHQYRSVRAILPVTLGPMHRALSVNELLNLILKQLRSHRHMVSAALVCSEWCESAYRVMQESPRALLPLLRLLGGIRSAAPYPYPLWVGTLCFFGIYTVDLTGRKSLKTQAQMHGIDCTKLPARFDIGASLRWKFISETPRR
jgi:hypothetical protein